MKDEDLERDVDGPMDRPESLPSTSYDQRDPDWILSLLKITGCVGCMGALCLGCLFGGTWMWDGWAAYTAEQQAEHEAEITDLARDAMSPRIELLEDRVEDLETRLAYCSCADW